MSLAILKYIGDSAKRIFSAKDLADLGATGDQLKSLSGNSVLTFVKNAAHDVEEGLAHFIAEHPTLAGEFHLLSDDEAKDEAEVTSPVTEGAAPGSTDPAGTTPAEAETSPAQTATTESAVSTEPSPATSEVASDTANQKSSGA
jgi:cell division septation protein DedD